MIALHNTDLVFEACHEGNRLWVALNVADLPITCSVDAGVERLAGNVVAHRRGGTTEIALPPHGWGILA